MLQFSSYTVAEFKTWEYLFSIVLLTYLGGFLRGFWEDWCASLEILDSVHLICVLAMFCVLGFKYNRLCCLSSGSNYSECVCEFWCLRSASSLLKGCCWVQLAEWRQQVGCPTARRTGMALAAGVLSRICCSCSFDIPTIAALHRILKRAWNRMDWRKHKIEICKME